MLGWLIAAVNGSTLLNDPWNTIVSPFTDLLGTGFYMIPVGAIGVGLYVKTRNPVMIGMYLLSSGSLLASGSIFAGMMGMVPIWIMVSAAGIASLMIGLLLRR